MVIPRISSARYLCLPGLRWTSMYKFCDVYLLEYYWWIYLNKSYLQVSCDTPVPVGGRKYKLGSVQILEVSDLIFHSTICVVNVNLGKSEMLHFMFARFLPFFCSTYSVVRMVFLMAIYLSTTYCSNTLLTSKGFSIEGEGNIYFKDTDL